MQRTTKAINYRHHNGATEIDFRGTPLLPEAHGEAKVENKEGLWDGRRSYVELTPESLPAHILHIRRWMRTERDFDYYL